MDEKLDQNDCTIGLNDAGTHAIIMIPIRRYALNSIDGNKLVFGAIKELEIHLLQMAHGIRSKQALNGIIPVNGKLNGTQPPDLRVH